MNLSSKLKLSGGQNIPIFGCGTYLMKPGPGSNADKVIIHALKTGYRLIDTAEYYENETEVGKAIKRSGIAREDIYVVTKLWDHGYDVCIRALQTSLKKLNTGYVDLYLIHSPLGGKVIDSYKAMVELKANGLVRSLGVSNFGIDHLEELSKAHLPTPEVNQIELHTFCKQEPLVEYCIKHGIAVMGYTPLARGQYFSDPILVEMSKKYKKTPAQIMLRWSIQMQYITIPKTEKTERLDSNANIFDFNLSQEDMKILNTLPNKPVTWNPVDTPWKG